MFHCVDNMHGKDEQISVFQIQAQSNNFISRSNPIPNATNGQF